jgi:hypothetical protein
MASVVLVLPAMCVVQLHRTCMTCNTGMGLMAWNTCCAVLCWHMLCCGATYGTQQHNP